MDHNERERGSKRAYEPPRVIPVYVDPVKELLQGATCVHTSNDGCTPAAF